MVADIGCHVLEASDGPAALELLRGHPEVDLLFTDVVMPGGMTGFELGQRAREERPALKVLYTSGYTELGVNRFGALALGTEFIVKPYGNLDLARKVSHILKDAEQKA